MAGGAALQGHPLLRSGLENSLGCVRFYLQTNKDWEDGSVGKVTCSCAMEPWFDPHIHKTEGEN